MNRAACLGAAIGYAETARRLLKSESTQSVKIDFAIYYLEQILENLEGTYMGLSTDEQVAAERNVQLLRKAYPTEIARPVGMSK